MGGTIHIWDTELDEPNPLEEFEPAGIDNQNTKDRGNIDICFNFDGTQLARGFKSKISIMNIEDEKIIWRHSLDDKEMNSMAFHPDGDQLAILTRSEKRFDVIEIFDVTTRNGDEAIRDVKFDLDGQANSIAFSPDGTRLAVSTDKLVGLWDLDLEEQVFFFPREELRSQLNRDPIVAFSPNNNYLASGWDENVRLWRTSATTSSMLYMNDLENDLEECAEKLIKESTGEDDIVDDDTVLLLLEKESKNLTAKEQTAIQNLVLKKMVERRKQLSSKTESDNASSTLPVAPDVRSEPTKTTLQSTRENDQDPGD
jgi:WD40 repeat protein